MAKRIEYWNHLMVSKCVVSVTKKTQMWLQKIVNPVYENAIKNIIKL
jgi:hypothetical protein